MNGGGLYAQGVTKISGGSFSGNSANAGTAGEGDGQTTVGGLGGALYAAEGAVLIISSTTASFSGNTARIGGAVYHDGSDMEMKKGSMTGNSAIEAGSAVYLADGKTFAMSGGSVTGNSSPQGAIASGTGSVIAFSGNAVVRDNMGVPAGSEDSVPMNVYLNYDRNDMIRTGSLGSSASIGVYVANGESETADDGTVTSATPIYDDHGIPGRIFAVYTGTGAPGSGARLNKFVNDRLYPDNRAFEGTKTTLTGMAGAQIPEGSADASAGTYYVVWPGMGLKLKVRKVNEQGTTTDQSVSGAQFTLKAIDESVGEGAYTQVWSGTSNSSGVVTIPWGVAQFEGGNKATFLPGSQYRLEEMASAGSAVRPAGAWTVTVGRDNSLTWSYTSSDAVAVNRILTIDTSLTHYLGDEVDVLNDVEPTITYDPNGDESKPARLSRLGDNETREKGVEFKPDETNHAYTVDETNPTRPSNVFRTWATLQEKPEIEDAAALTDEELKQAQAEKGYYEYAQGQEITFYRRSIAQDEQNPDDPAVKYGEGKSGGDMTLYAQWEPVVCKITDVSDRLLYVDGNPAVYMSLKDAFDDFNTKNFTVAPNGSKGTPRKIKMLLEEYTMTEPVELANRKTAILTTALNDTDRDYPGPSKICTIKRGSVEGSMITNLFNLTLTNITLDGGGVTVDADGGIVSVDNSYAVLKVSSGATLKNSKVSGDGGAVYGAANTTITVNGGTITDCEARNGGAVYGVANSTIILSGGSITGCKAVSGGAVYGEGKVDLSGTTMTGNNATNYGGGLYLSEDSTLSMRGGTIGASGNANTAQYGGGIALLGSGTISGGTVQSNTATKDGGGIYAAGSVTMSGGTVQSNTATENGGGVYMGEDSTLSISKTNIQSNSAKNGGGIYTLTDISLAADNPTNIVVSSNQANVQNGNGGNGGGVYVASGKTLTIGGATIGGTTDTAANVATNGGGIYAAGTVNFTGGSISANSAVDGAGVYLASTATFGMSKTGTGTAIISNNTASGNGGGIYHGGEADTTAAMGCSVSGGDITGNSASGNGGGVYVADGKTFNMSGGNIGNTKDENGNPNTELGNFASLGGAVYLADNEAATSMVMSGGKITGNSASGDDGGAINVAGDKARLVFSGTPVVYNNPNATAGIQQKNVVLSLGNTNIIRSEGITGTYAAGTAKIGVYVVDGNNKSIYNAHGIYDKPFGNFTIDGNLDVFRNDRNGALYGVKKTDKQIYWLNVVCKLTDSTGKLLYQDQYGQTPAVYSTVKAGFEAAAGTLYSRSGTTYSEYSDALILKMLQDYKLDNKEVIEYTTARDITVTTAETAKTADMTADWDEYFFKPADEATGDSQTKATLKRGEGNTSSMFTMNEASTTFIVTDIILDGNNVATTVNGGIVNVTKGKLVVADGSVLCNSSVTGNGTDTGLGGAVYVAASATAEMTGGGITGNSAVNGGAVYVAASATAEMTGGGITGNSAANGGAVYVVNGGTVTLKDGTKPAGATEAPHATINGNTATTAGAGIYLDYDDTAAAKKGATLKLEGEPNFGGTGTSSVDGSVVTADISGPTPTTGTVTNGNYNSNAVLEKATGATSATNGQKDYATARQDIFVAGYGSANAESIVVTGALTGVPGSIWVWADQDLHSKMLTQFAVLDDGLLNTEKTAINTSKITQTQLDATYKVFRNARDDVSTECGGDYLTGQEGDAKNLIKWTGGFDFVFKKIGPTGEALNGATFTLYMSAQKADGSYVPGKKNATTGKYEPAASEAEWETYQQTPKGGGDKGPATADSKTIASTNAVTIKVNTGTEEDPVIMTPDPAVYGEGLAVFEKIPPGVYFIKETTDANGIATIGGKKYKPVEEMYMVDINGKGFYTFYVATLADDGTTTWVKDDAHKAPMETLSVGSDTVDVPVALNVSAGSRKVVLRKVENSTTNPYGSIKSAVFDVYYADKQTVVKLKHTTTTVVNGVSTTTTTVEALQDLASKYSGAFWMGELPCGTYYIEETDSAGYKMPTHFFVLEVTDSGVMTKEISESSNAADLVPTDD